MGNKKVAIVTGGTKGIGKSITEKLLGRGYYVYTNYSKDTVAAAEAERSFLCISPNFSIIQADQSDKNAFAKFIDVIIQRETSVNCIICNAGATVRKSTMELTDDDWERVMQISVNSHFYLIRDLHNKIERDSRIIFIGSAMGIYPHATSLPYGVCKSAVHAMAKNLVKDFEGTGTTVNAIAPGFVETEWQNEKPQQIRENICKKTAAGRFAGIDEVTSAVIFCMDNAFVNGSVIEVNGGYCFK